MVTSGQCAHMAALVMSVTSCPDGGRSIPASGAMCTTGHGTNPSRGRLRI